MDDQGTNRAGSGGLDRDAVQLLQLINNHSGQWSWYQIARSSLGVDLAVNGRHLMKMLGSLKVAGFIVEIDGHSPALPLYVITDAGRQRIAIEENSSPTN